jgi:hypothetical protein
MRLFIVFGKSKRKLSPIEIGPGSNIEDAVTRRDNFVLLLDLVQHDHISCFVLLIALDGIYSTYFLATRAASSS